MTRHLLKLQDLTREDIHEILNLADQLKYETQNNIPHHHLAGQTLGMIFQKASTRTRVSFEVGMYQLGGQALFLSNRDLQIGRGEPVEDTARVLSRYLNGIMIRTFAQKEVEDLAKYGSIPVINGLTDYCHPCQVLADLMTIRERKGYLEDLTACYIGDGNNMANSIIVGCLKMGMKIRVATPKEYLPAPDILAFAAQENEKNPGVFRLSEEPLAAAAGADVLFTDVWASMGQEEEAQKRQAAFLNFQINEKIMSAANPGAMVQHCLPAHRGEEISAEVFESHAEEIFEEAENRLHAQKAVMVKLMQRQ